MDLLQERPHHDITELFAAAKNTPSGFLRVSAPMVRYSKLEFRRLLSQQGVQLRYTPMIIAESFINSEKARQNEFTTCVDDQPLIAQFAAKDATEFVKAAQLIFPYVDGIDLNCGCPQSWAIAQGYGCGLLRQPELVRDMVQTVRRTLPAGFSISVKLRLLNGDTTRTTVALARQLTHCGVTFLALHGRTASQKRTDNLNVPAMAEVKQSLDVPLIVNGSVRTWQDASDLYAQTQADGIMVARGLLANPALFNPMYKDTTNTPLECVQQWLDIAGAAGERITHQCFHHHLSFMWASHMKRDLRLTFNNLRSKQEVLNFLEERYSLRPSVTTAEHLKYTNCTYTHFEANDSNDAGVKGGWDANADGKFFTEFKTQAALKKDEDDDIELAGSFFTDLS